MSALRKALWLVAKLAALAFVGALALIQVPELRYDFGPATPVAVAGPGELARLPRGRPLFAAVAGRPEFDHAFVYRRYGLGYTYFTASPYGLMLVVRTHEKVDEEWASIDTLVGRLRPFAEQPFSYRIREILAEREGLEVPADAWFLALHDVPKPSGWQVGAVGLAALAWLGMVYGFFLRRRRPPAD